VRADKNNNVNVERTILRFLTEVELRHLFLTTGEVSLHCQLKPSGSSVRLNERQNISKNKKIRKQKNQKGISSNLVFKFELN
jgi:hypothetical protein